MLPFLLICLVVGGCTGIYRPSDDPIPGSQLTASGDKDDLDAAIEAAALWAEMAVLSAHPTSSSSRTYRLVTLDEEPVRLTASIDASQNSFTLAAAVGVEGARDPAREAKLLRGVARRLEQLEGVDVSPIR